MAPSAGTRLGPYQIVDRLGAGGMGEVWRARDTRLDRFVAIKFSREQFSDRFEREARAVAALNHPHICTLYDVGPDFLVMELIEGKLLRCPMAVEHAVNHAIQIAEALHAAHSAGFVHRDLKPGNVMMTAHGIKLLDFGLAARPEPHGTETDGTITLTEARSISGTLPYMAPEQVQGGEPDPRSDIFSFGVILYEMLTGERPFQGANAASLAAAILERDPKRLPGIPTPLWPIIGRCLRKNPAERWQSAYDVGVALQLASTIGEIPTFTRRRWRPAVLVIAVAGVLLAGAAWLLKRPAEAPLWSGAPLAGPALSMSPRVSPDGTLLAFEVLVKGQGQVAVMKPESGSYSLLTNQTGIGGMINEISWSRDGTRIYFDRFSDRPLGIYSVPVLGGPVKMVLDNAVDPQTLPDGSIVVVRLNPSREYQLFRFWPDSGRLQALPAEFLRSPIYDLAFSLRTSGDGKLVVFRGRRADTVEPFQLNVLELETLRIRAIGPLTEAGPQRARPVALLPDGKSVLVQQPAGGLTWLVAMPIYGGPAVRLFPLSFRPLVIDAAPDGSIYFDEHDRPSAALLFPVGGGSVERLTTDLPDTGGALSFGDRFTVWSSVAGGRRFVVKPGEPPVSLIETDEPITALAAEIDPRQLAIVVGQASDQRIAVVTMDGRVVRRLNGARGPFQSIAASPDGAALYYSSSGVIWRIPTMDGNPERVHEGESIAPYPDGKALLIQVETGQGHQLFRIALPSGQVRPVEIRGDLRIAANHLGPNAVRSDGAIAHECVPVNSWFYRPCILENGSGVLKEIPIDFAGDVVAVNWTRDGRLLARGAALRSRIWRIRRSAP